MHLEARATWRTPEGGEGNTPPYLGNSSIFSWCRAWRRGGRYRPLRDVTPALACKGGARGVDLPPKAYRIVECTALFFIALMASLDDAIRETIVRRRRRGGTSDVPSLRGRRLGHLVPRASRERPSYLCSSCFLVSPA